MWTYEYDDDTKLTAEQLKIASEWFCERIEEITGGIPISGIYFSGHNTIEISYEWDDYCRGCHMGTIRESYKIPNDVFFSDQSLSKWIQEEDEKRAKKKEREQKRKEADERRRKREAEREEYERLKSKFEKKEK